MSTEAEYLAARAAFIAARQGETVTRTDLVTYGRAVVGEIERRQTLRRALKAEVLAHEQFVKTLIDEQAGIANILGFLPATP